VEVILVDAACREKGEVDISRRAEVC
jgi:hypothetical protein